MSINIPILCGNVDSFKTTFMVICSVQSLYALYAPPFYVDSLPWQQPAARRTVFLLSAFPFSRWAASAGQRLSKNTRPWTEVYLHTKWHLDSSSRLATV